MTERGGASTAGLGIVFLLTGCLLLGALPAEAAAKSCSAVKAGTCPDVLIGAGHDGVTPLPLPCTMPLQDYQRVLAHWVNNREYEKLGWAVDKNVRDTGPFILGENYGTHPAVRIVYSPEVVEWLENGREGELPPGAMIIKQNLLPPADRFNDRRSEFDSEEAWSAMVQASVSSYAIMIRDCQTLDGWFWAGPAVVSKVGKTQAEFDAAIDATLDTNDYPFAFRASDHGQASCLRCHATSAGESTFSDLDNIEGTELRFRVDESWRTPPYSESQLTYVGGELIYLNSVDTNQAVAPQQRPAGGASESTLAQSAFHGNSSANNTTPDQEELLSQPLSSPSSAFVDTFQLGGGVDGAALTASSVQHFVGQWADHVPAGPNGAEQFITSDNCIGCHGGLGGAPSGITMFLQTGPNYGDGYNVSPFGEWRWSPMGLAGRDPIFYSQLATELAILDQNFKDHPEAFDDSPKQLHEVKDALQQTCLSCHGAMGQRQLVIDHANGTTDLDPTFRREYVQVYTALNEEQKDQPNYAYHKYGNLAREGISCAVCHHIDPPSQWKPGMSEHTKQELFLMHSTTGQFPYSPPNELNGPFDDVIEKPMQQALGITPVHNSYIQSSEMCGTCHTINLPNVDCNWNTDSTQADGEARCKDYPRLNESAQLQAQTIQDEYGLDYAKLLADNFNHSIEQATYLEWKNSVFADESSPEYQSCQDCHMPNSFQSLDGGIHIDPLKSQIASIQDSDYPEAAHSLPDDDLYVPVRSDYRRHELVGLNAFLVEMFDQFDPILGVDETDYMTSATTGDKLAIENMLLQGRQKTITVGVDVQEAKGQDLVADVTVTSLTGHRFPSGVGFRRAWIELLVLDADSGGEIVWGSGRTNSIGLIVDEEGQQLPTEFFEGNQWVRWQPHYDGITPTGCRACETQDGADGCWMRGEHGQKNLVCVATPPPVTRQDQVQIYEEVTLNGSDEVTFSFIHRDEHPKDNRFLPKGWRQPSSFQGDILQEFMAATAPEGVGNDPHYTEGKTGMDTVRYRISLPEGVDAENVTVQATMYSQSFQPYWLKRKFELSGHDPATQRLYYLASHLNTQGTVINDWKMRLVTCAVSADGETTSSTCASDSGVDEVMPKQQQASAGSGSSARETSGRR